MESPGVNGLRLISTDTSASSPSGVSSSSLFGIPSGNARGTPLCTTIARAGCTCARYTSFPEITAHDSPRYACL